MHIGSRSIGGVHRCAETGKDSPRCSRFPTFARVFPPQPPNVICNTSPLLLSGCCTHFLSSSPSSDVPALVHRDPANPTHRTWLTRPVRCRLYKGLRRVGCFASTFPDA